MKIIHISDLHFPTNIPFLSLRGKSIIGYANYFFRRKKKHDLTLIQNLLAYIKDSEYDALVISGDLTNVSVEGEFLAAKNWLEPLLDDRLFLIPGNHDRYRKESLHPEPLFEKYFGNYIGVSESADFYLRKKIIHGMTFIGWDSNRPLPIAKANGFVEPEVAEKTMVICKTDYFLVCHHPIWNPGFYLESNGHKMVNRKEISKLLLKNPPKIYFHGHSHSNWVKKPGKYAPYFAINSASSTRFSDSHHDCGFHIVNLDESGNVDIKRMSYHILSETFTETTILSYEEEIGQI